MTRGVGRDVPGPGFSAVALYEALDGLRELRGLDWVSVGRLTGVPPQTFSRLAGGGHPQVDALVRLLLWLGTTDVAPFLRG